MPATKTYLVEVVILAKGPGGTLSYFSTTKIAPGTFVKVPFRTSEAVGIALSTKEVRQEKLSLRQADFALRKIRQADILPAALGGNTIKAASASARFYAATLSAVLSTLLPKVLVEHAKHVFPIEPVGRKHRERREALTMQMEASERFGQYRTLVRQAFAKKESVMLVVPTHADGLRTREALATGIAEFVHLWSLEEKEAVQIWQKALHDAHPVLFITTPAGLAFPRQDVNTVILERENSRAYRTLARPFIDFRFVAEALAKEKGARFVAGDSMLSLERLWREKRAIEAQGLLEEDSLIRWRVPGAPARLIDARSRANDDGKFEIFSPELKDFIRSVIAPGEEKDPVRGSGIFLFGARRGLAPSTVCADCGTLLTCPNCGAPVVLHEKKARLPGPARETLYLCHACGHTRESLTLCPNCQSWRLVPLGIGTEEILRKAREHFPHVKVAILDKDHAPTDPKAKKIAKEFKDHGGILVGTELAFYYLEYVANATVVSLDALFSLPDFHANERIFYLVLRLKEATRGTLLVQTKNVGKQLLAWAAQGNILDFYQSEIAEREALLYPPFSIFIKIEGPRDVRTEFEKWRPDVIKHSLIIRLSRDAWPDPALLEKLLLLGPEFSVKVDPESIM